MFDLDFLLLTWPWNIKVMSWAHSVDRAPKPIEICVEHYGIYILIIFSLNVFFYVGTLF